MTQTVLAIGAGPEQLPTILKARGLGFRTIAVDGNSEAPGLSMADYGIHMDIMDASELVTLAKKFGVDATLPAPLGKPLITQGIVNDALGLSGVSRSAAELCTNKAAFQKLALRHGVRMPRVQLEADIGDLLNEGNNLEFPVVIKPVAGSGSRNVRVVWCPEDLATAVAEILADETNASDRFISQSFIGDTVLGLDGAIINGQVEPVLLRKKKMSPLPFRVEVLNTTCAAMSENKMQQIQSNMALVARFLGLKNCVFHADIVIDPVGDPTLVEFSARPSGVGLSAELVQLATGVDFLAEAIRLSLGLKCDFAPRHLRYAATGFLLDAGRYPAKPPCVKELERLPNVCKVHGPVEETPAREVAKNVKEAMKAGSFWACSATCLELADCLQKVETHLGRTEE